MKFVLALMAFVAVASAASVRVLWDSPTNSPAPVASYIIRYGPSSTNYIGSQASVDTNVRITNLPDNASIYLAVYAVSDSGVLSLGAATLTVSTLAPGNPRNLRVTNDYGDFRVIVERSEK